MIFLVGVLPSTDMEDFSAAEAAKYLGISREAVDAAARDGRLTALVGDGPRRFSLKAVEAYHQARLDERLAALARSRETPVSVAVKVRTALHAEGQGLPRPFAAKLAAMPSAWRSVFSTAELAAACVTEGCRWCEARKFADFRGLRPPEFSPALRELFGVDPCKACAPGLLAPYMAALAARVRRPGTRPADARTAPSAAERAAAREWALERAQAASAGRTDDDGRSLVAARRRQVQAQLTAAKRRGDQRHAIQLRQMLQSLTADATAVDYGRSAVTASAKPGLLACGHLLAAGCGCPRKASKRGRS